MDLGLPVAWWASVGTMEAEEMVVLEAVMLNENAKLLEVLGMHCGPGEPARC